MPYSFAKVCAFEEVICFAGMIAAAVFMFITCGIRESRSEHLEKESFETAYGVTGMVKEKSHAFENVFARGIASGVVLFLHKNHIV